MLYPVKPSFEEERIKDLYSYSILDTISEEDFDNLSAIASEICKTKISLISLIDNDRQWYKSHFGLDDTEAERNHSFCAHAINAPNDVLIVQDARKDERFHDNPFVTGYPHIIFYAGVPLLSENGFPIGSLCVINDTPQTLTSDQIHSLRALSQQVMHLLELRKKKMQLEDVTKNLNEKNKVLEKFGYTVAHDLRSPLNSIIGITNLISSLYKVEPDVSEMLQMIQRSSAILKKLIEDILEQSKSDKHLLDNTSIINIKELQTALKDLFIFNTKQVITFKTSLETLQINRVALEQIMINLISNAIKYNDKPVATVEIRIFENEQEYLFEVEDNGKGIAPEFQEKVFELFEAQITEDEFGEHGYGIGLASVKELVEKQGGTVIFDSTIGVGTRFRFSIRK